MATVGLVGSTGMVGSHILTTLLTASSATISTIYAFTRRDLPHSNPALHPLLEQDTSKWPTLLPSPLAVFISALGTTRANAGSVANQRKIDIDLNLDLAKAAKAAGATTYVLISSSSADSSSRMPYTKMKGELEDAVKSLGFEYTVILRPGLIAGTRQESRPAEWIVRKIADGMGTVGLKDFWAQDDFIIANAAVSAGLQCLGGEREKGVWVVGMGDIIKLGKTDWKDLGQRTSS